MANSQIVTYARVSGHYNKNNYPESFQITSILLDFQDSEEFNNSVPKVH